MKSPRLDAGRYRGQWVALHPKTHRVLAHRASLKGAKQAAFKKGVSRPLMYQAPRSDAYFVG